MKNKIKLTESQLINMIKKTVKTVLNEQSNVPNKQFPILNNTNQTATGKEKMMIDELNSFLSFLTNKKIDSSEKDMKKDLFINKFFSKSKKITIYDQMLEGLGTRPYYNNVQLWYDWVVYTAFATAFQNKNTQYKTGVQYFSLDENGKIWELNLA